MKPLDRILAAARANPRHIILPEGRDPRVAEAARRLTQEGLARVSLMNGPQIDGVTINDDGTPRHFEHAPGVFTSYECLPCGEAFARRCDLT